MPYVRQHRRRKPSILYRGASSKSLTTRGLRRTAGISLMPSTEDESIASVYAEDHVLFEGGEPIVVKFKTEGLKVEHDAAIDFQWNVLEDEIPKKNIIEVKK